MNASSNFEIVSKILECIKNQSKARIHSPGFCGMIGGYPVEIKFSKNGNTGVNINGGSRVNMYDKYFSVGQMEEANLRSIYLDGIESIRAGILTYTDELIVNTMKAFDCRLPKTVNIQDCNAVANEIISRIIEKSVK